MYSQTRLEQSADQPPVGVAVARRLPGLGDGTADEKVDVPHDPGQLGPGSTLKISEKRIAHPSSGDEGRSLERLNLVAPKLESPRP